MRRHDTTDAMVKKVKKAQILELRKHLMVGASLLPPDPAGNGGGFLILGPLLNSCYTVWIVFWFEVVDLTLLYKRCLCTYAYFPFTHSLHLIFLIPKFFLQISAMALG